MTHAIPSRQYLRSPDHSVFDRACVNVVLELTLLTHVIPSRQYLRPPDHNVFDRACVNEVLEITVLGSTSEKEINTKKQEYDIGKWLSSNA